MSAEVQAGVAIAADRTVASPLAAVEEENGETAERPLARVGGVLVADPPAPMSVTLTQAVDVLDKQYRLYSWNDSKALSVITADALLFAAVGFLLAPCLTDSLALAFLGTSVVFLAWSLLVVLRQVVPQGSSGKSGGTPNLRSLRGIRQFRTWEAYRDEFFSASERRFAEDAVRQIYGMADNNDASRRKTRAGVVLTSIAVVALIAAGTTAVLAARGIHLLGPWVTQSQQVAAPPPAVAAAAAPETTSPERASDVPNRSYNETDATQ